MDIPLSPYPIETQIAEIDAIEFLRAMPEIPADVEVLALCINQLLPLALRLLERIEALERPYDD